jgi:hypothetical protein
LAGHVTCKVRIRELNIGFCWGKPAREGTLVGKVSDYRLDGRGVGVPSPGRSKIFLLCRPDPF